MADERFGESNGVVFTNVRIIDGSGENPFSETIGILVIAVIGGMRHPIGPFLGAAVYVVLKTFAIDLVGADRFTTLIGALRPTAQSRPRASSSSRTA